MHTQFLHIPERIYGNITALLNDMMVRRGMFCLVRWIGILMGGPLLLLSLNRTLPAQESLTREYQIKATFLYNFTQFVQWPDTAFSEAESPLVIGVLGQDPFGSYLDETVKGKMIDNHPLVIQRYKKVEDVKGSHILFIGHKKNEDAMHALKHLSTQPVLTVSDVDGFARMGGMIQFINDSGRIRLLVNVSAATDANLVVSSKLLRLADTTTQKRN